MYIEYNYSHQGKLNNINSNTNNNNQNNSNNKASGYIVILYVQRLFKSIIDIYRKYGINTYFKANRTIKNILVSPKDKDPIQQKSGIIYWYKCIKVDCHDEYIGKSGRTFGVRYKENLKSTFTNTRPPGQPWPPHHYGNLQHNR